MSSTGVRFRRKTANQDLYLASLLLISILSVSFTGCSGLVSGNGGGGGTPTPLAISRVQPNTPTTTGFQVSWATNIAASSAIDYGTSASYGASTPVNSALVTSHQMSVTGLTKATLYHFRVRSTDAKNVSAVGSDMTFATAGDTTPPTVSITSPAASATLSGTVNVDVTASDNVGVQSVQLKIDNADFGAPATVAPYVIAVNTGSLSNGNHILAAVASDAAGNFATSAQVPVKVSNTTDTTPPTVSISSPANGATVSGTTSVTANASDNVGVASVQFLLDGANFGSLDTAAPYSVSWNTTTSSNGSHTVRAIAKDAAGNSATSVAVTVTVSNTTDTTPPTVSITAPANGATVLGTVTISANASDNVGVTSVQFLVDSNNAGPQMSSGPYTYSWDTMIFANGNHTITAVAKDAAGNSAKSAPVTVRVNNSTPPPGQSALATLARGMAPGTWAPLATKNFDGVGPFNNIMRPQGAGSILEYTDEAGVWNPVNKTVMVLGAAHNLQINVVCGESLFLKYADSSNSWGTLPNPCPNFDTSSCGSQLVCNMGHTYEHQTINPATGDFYHRELGSANVMVFKQATQAWSQCSPINPSGSHQNNGGLAYFPDRNSLVFIDGDWGVWELSLAPGNCTTNQWIEIASTFGGGPASIPQLVPFQGYNQINHYSSMCHCLIMGGGNGGDTSIYKYDASGKFTHMNPAPMGLTIPHAPTAGTVMTTDAVTGVFLVWDGNAGAKGTAWEYNPQTDVWTKTGITAPMFPGPDCSFNGQNDGVCETIAVPISDYGVVLMIQVGSANTGPTSVYVYKHTTGAPAQGGGNPLTISSVSASSISTISALVGWTTSAPADSQVDYGTTTNYGQSTALDATTVTNHSVSLTNLIPATLYHYRVKSHDSLGNLVTSSDLSFSTSTGAGNIPPVVSLTSVVSGATLSGTVTLTATATSSIGIASVQFQLDSANLGARLTSSPYSINWDTTTSSNGIHVVTAVAQDTAANTATSIGATITVSNNTVPASSADFQTRCNSPGVLRCIGFDSPSDITGVWGDNTGVFPGAAVPSLDSSVKASGNSSLKFTIPAQSSANSSGSYFANFSTDLSSQFGENSEFYIQWRQRFSPEFLTSKYQGGEGWKQTIIGTGDITGCTPSSGTATCSTSCSALEIVTLNTYQRNFPEMYQSCTGSTSHGAYNPFEEHFGSYDFKLQNAMPAPYCLYSQGQTSPPSYFPPSGNCFAYFPDEWMTFQVHVKTGPRVNDEFTNSFVQLWVSREGQPSQLVINWGPYNLSAGSATANQKYGKVWLLPYNTGKDATITYPTAYTWYDELVISTQKIQDPK
jgi:chitinase